MFSYSDETICYNVNLLVSNKLATTHNVIQLFFLRYGLSSTVIFASRFSEKVNENVLSKRKRFRFLSADPSSTCFIVASRWGRVLLGYASAVRGTRRTCGTCGTRGTCRTCGTCGTCATCGTCGTCETLYFLSKNSNEMIYKTKKSAI